MYQLVGHESISINTVVVNMLYTNVIYCGSDTQLLHQQIGVYWHMCSYYCHLCIILLLGTFMLRFFGYFWVAFYFFSPRFWTHFQSFWRVRLPSLPKKKRHKTTSKNTQKNKQKTTSWTTLLSTQWHVFIYVDFTRHLHEGTWLCLGHILYVFMTTRHQSTALLFRVRKADSGYARIQV